MTIEEATRILLQNIADRQKIVAPAIRHGIEKEIGSEFWLKRGQWEGLEMAYNIVHEWINDNADLLKEREAVKPKSKVRRGANAQIQHFCGRCNAMLHGKPKFCSVCGQEVKWKCNNNARNVGEVNEID